MAPRTYVTIYVEGSGDVDLPVEQLKNVAKQELGMVDGPFDLNIFGRTILVRSLQREQIISNESLKEAMGGNGDYRQALKAVSEVEQLMEQLGVEDSGWTPTKEAIVRALPGTTKGASLAGTQIGLLEDQPSLDLA